MTAGAARGTVGGLGRGRVSQLLGLHEWLVSFCQWSLWARGYTGHVTAAQAPCMAGRPCDGARDTRQSTQDTRQDTRHVLELAVHPWPGTCHTRVSGMAETRERRVARPGTCNTGDGAPKALVHERWMHM